MELPKPVEISPMLIDEARMLKESNKANQNFFMDNGKYNIKNLGTVHTPRSLVRYILNSVGYSPEKFESERIIDLASGTGSFTFEIASILHNHLISLGYDSSDYEDAKKIIEIMSNHIYAFDINSISILITLKRYLSIILDEIELIRQYDPNYLPQLNVYEENSLLSAYNLNLKFDYVVSNPPYVRYNEIDNNVKKAYKRLYETSSGKFDLYSLFFELGIQLLKNKGKLGYITPNSYFSTLYAKPLRSLILSKTKILKLFDLEEARPFSNVNVYPVITVLSKERVSFAQENIFPYIKVNEVFNDINAEYKPTNFREISVAQAGLGSNGWNFLPDSISSLRKNLSSTLPPISSLPIEIKAGVATGCDDIFVLKGDFLDIEDELLIPLIRGKDIDRYSINWERTYLLNPYMENGVPIDLEEYPLAKKYLIINRERLSRRYHVKKGKKWYETHDRVNLKRDRKRRIVGPDIAYSCRFAVEEGTYLCHNSCYSFFYSGDLDIFVAVLNSKFFEFVLKSSLPKIGAGYWRQMKKNLINLPILNPETFDLNERKRIKHLIEKSEWEEIDEVIFNKIGLQEDEVNIIYDFLKK
ncbi:hypothetical protein MSSIT_2812 [Methanosarcina siciliae T4/M]|uniref:site-specific DNA-methyltransferase (adenine-specific) n=1 Tax=Methanosarcina siciliae T4/M TaxID=1434120 RepID=A0A0E3L925_9EURY|nr:N-6 DNA methylase [Methanosarcina siciliae]AKB29531.1 hypothetical protein MSSIT_2812 [Methanosarcina siciliae T4/M]